MNENLKRYYDYMVSHNNAETGVKLYEGSYDDFVEDMSDNDIRLRVYNYMSTHKNDKGALLYDGDISDFDYDLGFAQEESQPASLIPQGGFYQPPQPKVQVEQENLLPKLKTFAEMSDEELAYQWNNAKEKRDEIRTKNEAQKNPQEDLIAKSGYTGYVPRGGYGMPAQVAYNKTAERIKNEQKEIPNPYESIFAQADAELLNRKEKLAREQLAQLNDEVGAVRATVEDKVVGSDDDMYLDIAEQLNFKTKKIIDMPKKYRDNPNGFFSSLGKTLYDWDMWSLGGKQIRRNVNLQKVANKINNDEELTKAETIAMESLYNYLNTQSELGDYYSTGAKIGEIAGQSVPFMAEMVITSGFGSLGSKALVKFIQKKGNMELAERVAKALGGVDMEKMMLDAEGNAIAKNITLGKASSALGRVGQELGKGVAQTSVMGQTWAGVSEDKLMKMIEGEDYDFLDFTRSFTNSLAETMTERVGGKLIEAPLKKVMPTYKIWGNAHGNGFLAKMAKRSNIDGFVGEVGEEYEVALLDALRSTNPLYSDEENAELRQSAEHMFSEEGLITTAGGIAPMTFVMGGINAGGYFVAKGKYNKAKNRLRQYLEAQGATTEEATDLISAIEMSENDAEYMGKMGILQNQLLFEYMQKNPEATEEELKAYRDELSKYTSDYFKASYAFNESMADLNAQYDNLSEADKIKLQLGLENRVAFARRQRKFYEENTQPTQEIASRYGIAPEEVEQIKTKATDNTSVLSEKEQNILNDLNSLESEFNKKVQTANIVEAQIQEMSDRAQAQVNVTTGHIQNVLYRDEMEGSLIKSGKVVFVENEDGSISIDKSQSDDVVTITNVEGNNPRQVSINDLIPVGDVAIEEVIRGINEGVPTLVQNQMAFSEVGMGSIVVSPNNEVGLFQGVNPDGMMYITDLNGMPRIVAPQEVSQWKPFNFEVGNTIDGFRVESINPDGSLTLDDGQIISPLDYAILAQNANINLYEMLQARQEVNNAPKPTTEEVVAQETNAQLQQDIADAKELGDDFVNTMLTQAQKALDKASKQKPTGTDANSYRASKNKIDAQVAQAQAEVDRWLAVQQALAQEQIQNTINNEQNESPKVENANQVGNVARDKFVNSKRFEGNTSVRTLPNGTQIKGRYMLVSAESLTPSHNPLDNWNTSEGFPLNERGQNINDRDYKNDVSAQNETIRIAQQYGGQAVEQVPTVSPEGVVYDGNGRTMAGIIAAQNGTDASYIETLKANASNFGFTPQQVNEIPSARVVFVTDEVLPYTTQTFAQFNQQEKKTQSSTENAVAKSKTLDAQTISQLLSVVDSFATLDSFFTSPIACADMLKVLQEKGIIAPTEVAGLTETNKNGELVFNAHGREFITDVLIGANFTENVIRQMAGDKGLKQSVLRALNVIIANRKLGEFALTKHINNAISLIREANNAKLSVSLYLRQTNMFEALATERYTAFEILMAEQLQSGVENFRELLSKYNNYARENQGGQTDMFAEGGLLSIEDITNIILEQYGHRTTQTEHAIQSSSRGENRANEEGIRERKQGNSEQQPNDTTELERKLLHLKEGESVKDFFERLKKTKQPILNRIQEWQNKVGVPVEVIISPTTIKNKIAYNEIAKGTNVKGWYDPNTGKAYIYLPNAESVKDVDETVMHEIIAHKGLRELLGKEKFDELCDAVWDMMSEKQRAEKLAYLNSTGAHRNATQQERQRAAADEYIAFLAENVQLKEDLTVWKSVVRKIKDILKSLGIKFRMSDEQLGELLRESARMFRDNALETDNQGKPVSFRITPEMIDANNQFNEELQQQIDGTLPKGHIYQIGMPSNILRSAGVVDLPIELSAEILHNKSVQENHPFSLESVSNLPMAIQNPIAVFDSRTQKESTVILTEMQYEGNNFVVVLKLRKGGLKHDIEVNNIQSLYPKDRIGGVVEWVNNGLLRYADKNKLVDLLAQSTNLIVGKETDLNDATKLIQNFENPKLLEENFEENNDIRFRVGTQIIETDNKTLVGLHNISERKFKEAMKRGGLANPSFAVIDTEKQSFDDFGEISLIMPSSLVDPKKNSGVYTGDIWSPTYPRIRKQIDKKGWKKIDDTIDALIEDKDIARGTKQSLFDYIEDGSSANAEYAFLVSKGITPKIVRKTNEGIVSTKELKDILGVSEDLNIGWDIYEAYKNLPEEKKEEINLWRYAQGDRQRKDDLVKRLNSEPKTEFAKRAKMSAEFAIKRELSFAEFDTFIYDVASKEKQNGTVDVRLTQSEARQYCYENNLDEEYRSWLNNLIDSVNPKEVFFTGYDYEGNPKYAKATLENISRYMKKEGIKNAYNDTGFDATRALLLKKLATLKEIQSNKDLLKTSDAVAEEIEVLKDKLYDIISRLSDMEKISDNQFINIDYANARLQEAIVKRNPIQYLNSEYGYDIEKDGEFAKDLSAFIEEVKLLPAKYFEGKFTRPVYLSEFSAAVVPNTISPSTTSYFVEANVPIYTYNPSVEGSRQEATMEAINNEGVRFRFIGEKGARNLDMAEEATTRLDNLNVARDMEEAQKDAKTIKMATGWERGADGKWRYEQFDGDIDVVYLASGKRKFKLSEILLDDELYKAYPELKDAYIRIGGGSRTGYWNATDKEIFINNKELKEIKWAVKELNDDESYYHKDTLYSYINQNRTFIDEIIIHEIQHAIQDFEGFAKGGNVNMFVYDALSDEDKIKYDKLSDNVEKKWEEIDQYDLKSREYYNAVRRWQYADLKLDAFMSEHKLGLSGYTRLAGEVEARNVQSRKNMLLEEIRGTLATETEDVAREDQIFIYDALANASSEVRFRVTPEMEQIKSKAQADGTFMKAPNGKSTNLDERQWLHVRTKNFKNYFGDWINDPENASKVVDENGEPKVMYHGTPNKFNIFDQSKIERGNGFWFTSELSEAESYAWSEDGDGNVISVFLNAKNLATLDEVNGGLLEEYRKEVGAKVSPEVFIRDKQASDYMRSKGYDALMFDDKVIVYKPNQIKSATENEGGYSESNNDIRFRVTPESTPIFVSNALVATQKIKQEKATPQQWLAMIEKNAGIKAGEDKWLGLSDWLKSSTAKTLTKDEVLEYIRENMIDVQEVWYGEMDEYDAWEQFKENNPEIINDIMMESAHEKADEYVKRDDYATEEEYEDAYDEYVSDYLEDDLYGTNMEKAEVEARYNFESGLYGSFNPIYPINYTRLEYTTEGLDNKKEVALVVPTIDSWNQSDAIHFGDAGDGRAVAWVRFGETYDADGNRVLVIDEIQSKRHQAGRDVGYTDLKSYEKEKAILDEKASELFQRRNKLIGTLAEKYGDFTNYTKKIGETYSSKLVPNEDVLTSDEVKEWNETSQDVIYEAQKELDKKYRSGVPDAPFEKNWQELAMKRMMRYATENGFDKLAWTKGEQQAKRYALSNTVETIHAEDSLSEMEDGTEIKKEIAITTTQDSIIRLYVDANGNVLSGEFKGKHLSEIVGKDVASRLMADGEVTLEPMDLEIGGEGMKGFYDKMLPSFVNKYGKKWGVKVGEVTLPYVEEAGRTMHSIDITDTMKEQLDAEAQPMFRILANPAALVNAPKPNEVGHENETFMEYLQRYEQWRNDKIAYENYTDSEIPQFPSWDKDRMTFKQYLNAINDYKRGVEKLDLVSAYNQAFFTKWKEFKEAMKTLNDSGHRIRAFYKWVKSQGANIDPKDNAYNDSHRRNSRMQHVLRVFEQNQKLNMMNAMNAILRSGKLDGLGFTWQNIDSDTTPAKERRNGTPLTRQEILSVYAQAKDCKEAKELGLPDRGENAFKNNLGMSYQDVIDAVEGAVDPRMIYNLWDAIKAVNDFALDYQLKYGMIDQATRDSLNRKYYVPERGWKVRDMDGKIDGYMPSKNGSKYSSFNPALVKAHGRTSLASDPFPYMLSIAHSSVVATEKNRTLQALYRGLMKNERLGRETGAYKIRRIWGMIAKDENGNTIYDREGKPITLISYEAPTAEMYKHDKEIDEQVKELRKENSKLRDEYVKATPTRQAEINQEVSDNNAKIKKLEESKYMTAMIEDTTIKYRTKNETKQHIIKLKVDGADVEIEFKDEKLANAINGGNWVSNMNDGWMKNTISRISKLTQKLSSWKTQYNYEFAVANFTRDLILSHMINGIREGEVFALKASKEVFASMGTIASYLSNGKNLDKMKDSKRKQYLQEFLENGALTGFSFTKPIEDISEELYKELMRLDGDNRTTQEKVARLKHLFAEKGENALAFLSELSEMSVRFAQYVTCRDAGKTIEASATSAKEITTNFDRKSQLGNAFGWEYGFFNAAIQGTMNIAYAVKDNPKRGAAMLSAWSAIFVGLGYAMASLFAPDDPEDETYLTEWDRWTNLTIPLPGKNTIVIPLPHVMRAFNALGVNMAMVEKGRKPLNQAIGDVVQFFLDELTPSSPLQIQNFADYNDRTGKWEMDFVKYAQGAMPTFIQPVMDVVLDRNFMNAPIAKRVWNDNIADIHRANAHTEQFFIDFTHWLNKKSGGDPNMETKYKGIDINPSNIKHILTGYGGGLPQLIIDTGMLIYNTAKGNDIQTGEIPFLRKVVRTYDDKKAYTSEYWDLKNKVDTYKATLKDALKNSPETYDQLVSSEEYEAYIMAQGVLDGITKPKEATEFTQQDINDMIWANKMMNKGKVVEKPE